MSIPRSTIEKWLRQNDELARRRKEQETLKAIRKHQPQPLKKAA
jgi:hypothetical protein